MSDTESKNKGLKGLKISGLDESVELINQIGEHLKKAQELYVRLQEIKIEVSTEE